MGTKLAPALATLFLAGIEERFLATASCKPVLWLRYIDDILCVWSHGRPEFTTFLAALNNLRPRLRFTATISATDVVFLDLVLYKGTDFHVTGRLQSRLHRKDTMHQLYVRGSSFHPPHTTLGVAVGETMRALRACSEELHFRAEQRRLVIRFRQLGFSRRALREARAIRFLDRPETLAQNTPKTTAMVFFVTKFARFRPSLNVALRKHWLAVESSPTLSGRFASPPLLSNTGHPNLLRRLTRALINDPSVQSTLLSSVHPVPRFSYPRLQDTKCGRSACTVCASLMGHSFIRSHATHALFPVDPSLSCRTVGVVYCLHCVPCGKQYVGQTGCTMRVRLAHHRDHFFTQPRILYRHLQRVHHITSFDMDITLIAQVPDLRARLDCESGWIRRLRTAFPRGLNNRL